MLNFQAWVFRFSNVVGSKSRKTGTTVITDFIDNLKKNPKELHILGDGNQSKSFLHVDDCVDGMVTLVNKAHEQFNLLNLCSEDSITIKRLAEIVVEEMGLRNVRFTFAGTPQGWKGDVTKMLLDTSKINRLGWRARYNSEEAVCRAVRGFLGQ
jgi:UDP-glucose 4-epimerase